jgi:hypothetical protein
MTKSKTGVIVVALLVLVLLPSACGGHRKGAKHPAGGSAVAEAEPDTSPKCRVNGPVYTIPAPGPIASASASAAAGAP